MGGGGEDGTAPVRPMHIGELAQRSEMSLRTLRHYDEVGLLRPSGRSEGGFRLYTEDDLATLLIIRRMKPLGFTLDEMMQVMRHLETLRAAPADPSDQSDARAHLAATLDDAHARRDTLRRQLAMADEFIGLLDQQLR